MNNPSSKPHPLIASFCDLYFLGILAMAILAIATVLSQKTIYTVGLAAIVFLLIIAVVIFYHIFYSKKTKFLSIGEKISGKILKDGKKHWVNPYDKNRWWIFFMIIVTLIFLGNDWDVLENGVIPIGVVIGKIIKFSLVFLGFVMIGKGKVKGALIPFSVFLVNMVISYLIFTTAKLDFFLGASMAYMLMSFGYLFILIIYRKKSIVTATNK